MVDVNRRTPDPPQADGRPRPAADLGSFNYIEPATTLNDENIVVIGDLEGTDPAAQADQQQLAGFVRTEIDRIITDLAQPV